MFHILTFSCLACAATCIFHRIPLDWSSFFLIIKDYRVASQKREIALDIAIHQAHAANLKRLLGKIPEARTLTWS